MKDDDDLDPAGLKRLLQRVQETIHEQPDSVRYAMNGFLIALGTYVQGLSDLAARAAAKVGQVLRRIRRRLRRRRRPGTFDRRRRRRRPGTFDRRRRREDAGHALLTWTNRESGMPACFLDDVAKMVTDTSYYSSFPIIGAWPDHSLFFPIIGAWPDLSQSLVRGQTFRQTFHPGFRGFPRKLESAIVLDNSIGQDLRKGVRVDGEPIGVP